MAKAFRYINVLMYDVVDFIERVDQIWSSTVVGQTLHFQALFANTSKTVTLTNNCFSRLPKLATLSKCHNSFHHMEKSKSKIDQKRFFRIELQILM